MNVGKVISRFGQDTIEIAKKMIEDDELCQLLYFSDDPYGSGAVSNKRQKLLHNNIVVNTEAPVQNNRGSYILINFNIIFFNCFFHNTNWA